jgi:hypothetical protein
MKAQALGRLFAITQVFFHTLVGGPQTLQSTAIFILAFSS